MKNERISRGIIRVHVRITGKNNHQAYFTPKHMITRLLISFNRQKWFYTHIYIYIMFKVQTFTKCIKITKMLVTIFKFK